MAYPEENYRRRPRGNTMFTDNDVAVDEDFIKEAVKRYLENSDYAQELEPDAMVITAFKALDEKGHGRRISATMSIELQTAFRNAFKTAVKRVSANVLHAEHKEENR